MCGFFFILLLLLGLVSVQSHQFHCDLISFLSKKPYVEKPTDLLGVRTHLRIITVGVSSEELGPAFNCKCAYQSFSLEQGRSALVGLWQCGEISVAQFSDPKLSSWNSLDWEEFGIRTSAHVEWGEKLQPSTGLFSYFSSYHFETTWFKVISAQPLMLYVSPNSEWTASALKIKFGLTDVVAKQWNRESNQKELRSLLIELSEKAKRERAEEMGKQKQSETCKSECDRQLQFERVRFERSQRVDSSSSSSTREIHHAFQKGYKQGEESCKKTERQLHETRVELCKQLQPFLECPITKDLLVNPVINCKSGLTYSKAAFEEWIRRNPTDPQTREMTLLADLQPNILVRQIIEFCATRK